MTCCRRRLPWTQLKSSWKRIIFLVVGLVIGGAFVLNLVRILVGAIETHLGAKQGPAQGGCEGGEEGFPHLIHQVWIPFGPMPSRWNTTITSLRARHTGYQYKLWMDRDIERLLAEEYPWFIGSYYSYANPIQKVDVAKYFILLKYGGTYIDMDLSPKIPLDSIVTKENSAKCECLFVEGTPGVTTDVMTCKRGSPFVAFLTSQLDSSNNWYMFPYATIMFTTGPGFLSRCLYGYDNAGDIKVLPHSLYGYYFTHVRGESWMTLDGMLLNKIHGYFLFGAPRALKIVAAVFGVVVVVLFIAWKIRQRRKRRQQPS